MQQFIRPALAALVCGLTTVAFAAPMLLETFGNIRYNTPKNWKADVGENAVFITPKDEKEMMAIVLLPGMKSEDSADEGVKKVWKFFTKALEMEGEMKSQKSYKTDAGIRFVSGTGKMTKDGDDIIAMVNVYEVNGSLESVVVLAKDGDTLKKYSSEVVAFLNGVAFGKGGDEKDEKKGDTKKGDTVDAFIQGLK